MTTPRNRRDVLRLLAGGIAGAVFLPAGVRADAMRRLHDPLDRSDSTTDDVRRLERVGLQLYTVRAALAKDIEGTIAAIAAAGVTELEFAGYLGKPAAWWRALLAQHKLTAPSTHIGLPATDAEWTPQFEMATALGHQWIVVPSVSREYTRDADGWKRLADRLNAGGALAKKAGLRMGYHNHDTEVAPIAGGAGTGLDLLLASTDASLVDFELDIYWAVYGGADPLALIAKYPKRFALCHVKDAGPAPKHEMLDVGAGTIDFATIIKRGRASGLKHWFIEHDRPTDPIASVQASARALSQLKV